VKNASVETSGNMHLTLSTAKLKEAADVTFSHRSKSNTQKRAIELPISSMASYTFEGEQESRQSKLDICKRLDNLGMLTQQELQKRKSADRFVKLYANIQASKVVVKNSKAAQDSIDKLSANKSQNKTQREGMRIRENVRYKTIM